MKIRNKITLWITGAGLIAGLFFSLVIIYELIEQPYDLLDGELDSQASTLLTGLNPHDGNLDQVSDGAMLGSIGKLYWFKVYNTERKLIYSSFMTQFADLPMKNHNHGYKVNVKIPREVTGLEKDDSTEVIFRIRVVTLTYAGQEYLVQIARPMEKLQEEINDLILSLSFGLVGFSITLILLGYFVAGKILQPIAEINRLAHEITETTLDKRIPLGKNKDELYNLITSLNLMFDRLQFSFKRQKDFIANASHELKTPIALQRLFLGEAQQREDLPSDFTASLAAQSKTLLRMDRLVKKLLDLSSLELGGHFTSDSVNLSRLVTSVLSEFNEIIYALGINLSGDIAEDVILDGDKEKLRQMFINLIDNAIKYNAHENGKIHVVLHQKTKRISLEVYNTGKGIPVDELVPVHKWPFRPNSASYEKNNARNINYMPVLIFFAVLDFERNCSFMDRHELDSACPKMVFSPDICVTLKK